MNRPAEPLADAGDFIDDALALARALAALHLERIVHLDLRPAHLHLEGDGASRSARIDASPHSVSSHDAAPVPAGVLDEPARWPYLAPETTGRVAARIDERSDLYALGVVLYQRLTGRLPFEATDALQWLHCHLAQRPPAPRELDARIAPALSDIVAKLLEKSPEARYQSASGLARDLERCRRLLDARGSVPAFALGAHDFRAALDISARLCGRDRELAALDAALQAAQHGGFALALVAGWSGIGKSALVQAAAAARPGLLFAAGKFDQYQRDTPYATFVQALRELMRGILGSDDAALTRWRERLGAALGEHAGVVAEVVPELELVLGPLPAAPVLGPAESRNRFNLAMQRLVQACAAPQQPLLLFLDDMQWADAGTLDLVRALAGAEPRACCLLLAWRDNEVDAAHPLARALERIVEAGARPLRIALGALDAPALAEHLGATLRRPPAQAEPLAELLLRKTGGNPFFVNEFVKTLQAKALLALDTGSGAWQWDVARIEAEGITENVVTLLAERLSLLEPGVQRLLTLAAAFGNQVQRAQLALLAEREPAVLERELAGALALGLLVQHGSSLRFAHDRIQQAAYGLVPEAERAALHLAIGRRLLHSGGGDELLFDTANQLLAGAALIDAPAERAHFGALLGAAGRKAKAAAAADSALRYFDAAVEQLGLDEHGAHDETAFALLRDRAECEFLTGRLDAAEAHFEALLGAARSDVARAEVYFLWIKLQQVAGNFQRALALGEQAVGLFGIELPSGQSDIERAIAAERDAIAGLLHGRRIADIALLPRAADARMAAAVSMLSSLGPPTFLGRPAWFPLVVTQAVRLSLEHGHCEDSCFAYSMYAMLLVSAFDDIAGGDEFSRMCIALNERLADPKFKGTVLHIHGSHISCWRHPFADGFDYLARGFAACVAAGDVTVANYNGFQGSWQYLMASARLAEADAPIDKYLDFARTSGHQPVLLTIQAQRRLQRALQGQGALEGGLDGDGFDALDALAALQRAGFVTGVAFVQVARLVLGVTFGDFDTARDAAGRAAEVSDSLLSLPIEADFSFYRALALAAGRPAGKPLPDGERALFDADSARLARWAIHAPANFEQRLLLLQAEAARLDGDAFAALPLYERAIGTALANGATRDAALACETAARFYFAAGVARGGAVCLRQASSLYREWGAHGKRRQIDRALFPALAQNELSNESPLEPARAGQYADAVDLLAVLNAAQAISLEIDRDRLLGTLMRNVMQQAGAQCGRLLLVEPGGGERLVVTSEAGDGGLRVDLHPDAGAVELPLQLLAYVRRSREAVVLHDAATDRRFAGDDYARRRKVRSVLALPIVKQGRLDGLLYLENNLAAGAFAADRVATLEVLAGQIAISLDNARLYAELKDGNERMDLAVRAGGIGIWSWDLRHDRVSWDDGMRAINGGDAHDLASVLAHVHADDRERVQGIAERGLREGGAIELEYRIVRPDGQLRAVKAAGYAVLDEHGAPAAMSGVMLDVTASNEAQAQREALLREQAARAQAESDSRAKDEFLATLAHELRNPLAPLRNGLLLLERDAGSAPRVLPMMQRQTRHLVRLVDDLLELSRLTLGKIELRRQRVALAQAVDAAVETVRPLLDERGHALVIEPMDEALWLDADPARLTQVLANLLDNAAKYTPPGGRISVVARRDGNAARIAVRDNGIGIEPLALPGLFELFAQGDQGTGSGAGVRAGLGIGLALVRRLVALHGGEVGAASEGRGHGSEFTLRWPLAEAQAASTAAPAAAAAPLRGTSRVLVVDDNRDAADSLAELLMLAGAEVRVAYGGAEALAEVEREAPALAVLDLGMPGIDGYEVARRIRARREHDGMTLIALTGWGQQQDRSRTRDAGFDHHLVKPVELQALQALLGEAAERVRR